MAERPEDLNLPNAVVTRIIKDSIPDGVNVSKEARLAISKAASVFVLYATSCSNNFAMKGKRKTISAQDVLSAMDDMEFEQFVEPLNECLEAFRKDLQGKKEATEKRKKEKEQNISTEDADENNGEAVGSDGEDKEVEVITVNGDDDDDDENSVEEVDDDVQEIEDDGEEG